MKPSSARSVLILAGLVTFTLTLGACASSNGTDTTSTVAGTTATTVAATTTTTSGEAAALDVVESAFTAYNSGDMATWFLWREGGSPWNPVDAEYLIAVESRYDVQECTYRGYAEWQMDDRMIGHGFDCAVTQTDLILEAAGIELEMIYNWVIGADPESSLAGSNEDWDFLDAFMNEYRVWLETNHPEVGADITYQHGTDFVLPESVPTALEYIDEFVAQSDDYPLTAPVPASEWGGPLS